MPDRGQFLSGIITSSRYLLCCSFCSFCLPFSWALPDELADAGIDTGREKAKISADLALGRSDDEADDIEAIQVLNAMFLLSDFDLYVSDEKYFEYFADPDVFADLSLLLESGLLSEIPDEDRYYYTDRNGARTLLGICLGEDSALHKAGYYHNEVVIGAVAGGDNLDKAIAVISQLLSNRK